MPQVETTTIVADCGHRLQVGENAFSHYTMREGVIGEPGQFDGWFYLTSNDGSRALLNGQRVCCLDCARRYGHLKP